MIEVTKRWSLPLLIVSGSIFLAGCASMPYCKRGGEIGRYQVVAAPQSQNSAGLVLKYDTVTGEVWRSTYQGGRT